MKTRGLFAGLVAVFRNAFRPALFRAMIADGKISEARGQIPRSFLSDLMEVLGDLDVKSGEVRGVASPGGVRLEFSGVPESAHQRIRNVWQLHAPKLKRSAR